MGLRSLLFTIRNFAKLRTENSQLQMKYTQAMKRVDFLRCLLNRVGLDKIPPAEGKFRDNQLVCLHILKNIVDVIDTRGMPYWLDGGTLLGAVRHKGFIPWDDDADICMMRDDFLKVIPLLKKRFEGTDYTVREQTIPKWCSYQIRIHIRGNAAVGVDVFPLSRYFRGNLSLEERLKVSHEVQKARIELEGRMKSGKMSLNEIRSAIVENEKEKILLGNYPVSDTPALYASLDFKWGGKCQVWNWEQIFPLKKVEFEGLLWFAPNNTNEYLSDLYGEFGCFSSEFFRCKT